ncbi:MAG: acetoacetate decarboxylase family protein [Anaerolineae bacterium]|nr:acetoacetate decarboxylase family protein [Anaerolineae bacterium]
MSYTCNKPVFKHSLPVAAKVYFEDSPTISYHCGMVEHIPLDLHNVPFFASLSEGFLQQLEAEAQKRIFQTGETLFYEGDPPATLSLLLEGQVDLSWGGSPRGFCLPGSLLDPAAVLGDLPHTVKAVASTTCHLLEWQLDGLWGLPAFQEFARRHLADCLREAQSRLSAVAAPIHYTGCAEIQPGPYLFPEAAVTFVFCDAARDFIEATLPEGVSLLKWPGGERAPILLGIADFPNAHPESAPSARFSYTETTVFVPARLGTTPGVFIPYIYPSAWEPILVGREVYGFPKQLGNTVFGAGEVSLSVDDRPWFRLSWEGQESFNETKLVGALMSWLGIERHVASAAFQVGDTMRQAVRLPAYRRIDVFNHKRVPSVDSSPDTPRYDVDQLTQAVFGVLRWFSIVRLSGARLTTLSGPLHEARLTLREAYRTRLDMRLSTGRTVRDYLGSIANP